MQLYDTLTKKKKKLTPRSNKKIEIFVCGPTVYDYSHIGHARTYIAFDSFVKYLRSQEYEVRYVQNITDIDDKIIARAKELSLSPHDVAITNEAEYLHDMETLQIDSIDKYARATDYIPQIISQIERLIAKGYAYEINEDGIYFEISKFKDYGKLSNRTTEQAEDAVSRIDESVQKRNKGDFALWKFSKKDEPKWESPWGDGRPGWHIEDTAITETEFGAQYDIHGGARDLIFPHHESEIAQMEAISESEPLVNHWMHPGFLTVSGEKMSKSLGNFITIHEFLEKHSKETLRLFILSSHYRSAIDYTEKAVAQAETNIRRLKEFYEKITAQTQVSKAGAVPALADPAHQEQGLDLLLHFAQFKKELARDFNTPKALAQLFELVREGNTRLAKEDLNKDEAASILEFLNYVNKIFGIIPHIEEKPVPQEIIKLGEQRENLRKEKKWEEADEIRKQIEDAGHTLEDTSDGPKIKTLTLRE